MKPWQFMWMWLCKLSPPKPVLFHIRQFCKRSLYYKTTSIFICINTKTFIAYRLASFNHVQLALVLTYICWDTHYKVASDTQGV